MILFGKIRDLTVAESYMAACGVLVGMGIIYDASVTPTERFPAGLERPTFATAFEEAVYDCNRKRLARGLFRDVIVETMPDGATIEWNMRQCSTAEDIAHSKLWDITGEPAEVLVTYSSYDFTR